MNFCVRHQLIDHGKRQPQQDERQQVKNKAAEDRSADGALGRLKMRAAGQSNRGCQQQRPQRNGRPIQDDSRRPAASARDAPDVVKGCLDVRQHLDGDKHKQQHAHHAERAAPGVLDEFMDALGRFLLHGSHAFVATGRRGNGGGVGGCHGAGRRCLEIGFRRHIRQVEQHRIIRTQVQRHCLAEVGVKRRRAASRWKQTCQ